jgi:SAM-dependent methyltransferase
MSRPTIAPQLHSLILDGLAEPYVSESCQDAIPTDNHYQSVTLGSNITPGFRSVRYELMNQIAFAGSTVLDLGSNLGELSRAARAQGASLVDGFEFDPFFVEIANAVNAYNGTTRVSFYERDITSPATYEERYDIVLAFSVYVYIKPLLNLVAGITGELLVLETHALEDNLDSYYTDPVSEFLPYYKVLGESEWGVTSTDQSRAVIAFARSQATLDRSLIAREWASLDRVVETR